MNIPVFGPLKLSTGQKLPIRDVLYTPSPGFVLVGPRALLPPAAPREPIEYAAVLLKCEPMVGRLTSSCCAGWRN